MGGAFLRVDPGSADGLASLPLAVTSAHRHVLTGMRPAWASSSLALPTKQSSSSLADKLRKLRCGWPVACVVRRR